MDKNKLYTVNKWNRPMFGNQFLGTGEYPNFLGYTWPEIQNAYYGMSNQQIQRLESPINAMEMFGNQLPPLMSNGELEYNFSDIKTPYLGNQNILGPSAQQLAIPDTNINPIVNFDRTPTAGLNPWVRLANQNQMGINDYANSKNFLGLSKINNPFSAGNIAGGVGAMANTPLGRAGLSALSGIASTGAQKLISDGFSTGVGNTIGDFGRTAGAAVGQFNPLLGAAMSVGSGVLGGAWNHGFGIKTNQQALNNANSAIASWNNFRSNANTYDQLPTIENFGGFRGPYTGGWFRKGDARNKNNALREQWNNAYDFANRSIDNNIANINNNTLGNFYANYAACGGHMDRKHGLGGNLFYDGGDGEDGEVINGGRMKVEGQPVEFSVTAPYTQPYTYYSPWDRQWYGIGYGGAQVPVANPGKYSLSLDDYMKLKQDRAKSDDVGGWHQLGDQVQDLGLALVSAPMFEGTEGASWLKGLTQKGRDAIKWDLNLAKGASRQRYLSRALANELDNVVANGYGLRNTLAPVVPIVEDATNIVSKEPAKQNLSFLQKKNNLQMAERVGIPKGERNQLSALEQQGLKDLEQYMNSGQYRQSFKVIPTNNGVDVGWVTRNAEGEPFVKWAVDNNISVRGPWIRTKFTADAGKGILSYNMDKNMAGYSSQMFPMPDNMKWAPGEANMFLSGNDHALILTSPRVDVQNSIDGAVAELVNTLPATIDKNIMRDFWINARKIQKPGTYLSGDNGAAPIGSSLIDAYKKKQLYKAGFKEKPLSQQRVRRQGLSPDSYSSIIRQGNRDGSLRWGEGFADWNPSAVENKHIYEAYNKFKKGEITQKEYEDVFNAWSQSMGGMPLQWVEGKTRMIPVHPHPYIYQKSLGGNLFYDGSVLPEVVVTPSKEDRQVLENTKWLFPDKDLRDDVYNTAFRNTYNTPQSQNEWLNKVTMLHNLSGNPTIHRGGLPMKKEDGTPRSYSMALSPWNHMYNINSFDNYVNELGHSYLYRGKGKKYGLDKLGAPGWIDSNLYSDPNSSEYKTHGITVPAMKAWLRDWKGHTFDDYLKSYAGYSLGGNLFNSSGGIHIDPSKKGTFTAAASKHGMGVQEFASKVLSNKEDYSPAMVKKANFAHVFGGRNYSNGGNLYPYGGYAAMSFLDNFEKDPLSAVMSYNASMQQLAEDRLARQEAEEKEAQMADLQKRLLAQETQNDYLNMILGTQQQSLDNILKLQQEANSYQSAAMPTEAYTDSTGLEDYIKREESFLAKPKWDVIAPSIGYGFTKYYPGTHRLVRWGDTITREAADKYLHDYVQYLDGRLSKKVPNWNKLARYQKDALIDIAYNAGPGAAHFKPNSKLMNAIANEDWTEAAKHLDTYSEGKRLNRRSNARINMFTNGRYALGGNLFWPGGGLDSSGNPTETPSKYTWRPITDDYIQDYLPYDYTATEVYKAVADKNFRENPNAEDIKSYFKDYVNSPGYARIMQNQNKWWEQNHPIKDKIRGHLPDYAKWLVSGPGDSAQFIKNWVNDNDVNILEYDGHAGNSFYDPNVNLIISGNRGYETKKRGYGQGVYEVLGHEFGHFANQDHINGVQKEALDLNTNTLKGHDSRPEEKHADIWGLKYLLYKTGIYDSRSGKDITVEDIQKLRRLYPMSRPLQQMDDEKVAWTLNHVAQNNTPTLMNDNSFYAAFGGELGTNGTDWTAGLINVDNGLSHEINPYGGVQMGVDQQGTPNYVEEGETVYNGYVFSKRNEEEGGFNVPIEVLAQVGIKPSKKQLKEGITYAEASKEVTKEAKERPNDSLSKAGMEHALAILAQSQEQQRQEKQAMEQAQQQMMERYMAQQAQGQMAALGGLLNSYAYGGNMFPSGGNTYTVRKGDNFSKIARANGMSLKQLLDYNSQIKDINKIFVNDVINLGPASQSAPVVPTVKTPAVKAEVSQPVVQQPDFLQTLAGIPVGSRPGVEQCATWQNNILRDNGYAIGGSAWRLYNADTVFSGYNPEERPQAWNRSAVEAYNDAAANRVLKNFKSGSLDKNKVYTVNMYLRGSKAQEEAYRDGSRGAAGTHSGILSYDEKSKSWIVTHNMHNKIHRDKFLNIQGGGKKMGVTAIYEPVTQKQVDAIEEKKNRIKAAKQANYSLPGTTNMGWFNLLSLFGGSHALGGNLFATGGGLNDGYSPLTITYEGANNDDEYMANVLPYINSLSSNKEALQGMFGLTSDEYNNFARLATGIAQQETKYGTSPKYKAEQIAGEDAVLEAKKVRDTLKGKKSSSYTKSRGYSKIKMEDDSPELQKIYSDLGLNYDNVESSDKSALATMARLAYDYNNWAKDSNYLAKDGTRISPYDAILYNWVGRSSMLNNGEAVPSNNSYLRAVKDATKDFGFITDNRVPLDGELSPSVPSYELTPSSLYVNNTHNRFDEGSSTDVPIVNGGTPGYETFPVGLGTYLNGNPYATGGLLGQGNYFSTGRQMNVNPIDPPGSEALDKWLEYNNRPHWTDAERFNYVKDELLKGLDNSWFAPAELYGNAMNLLGDYINSHGGEGIGTFEKWAFNPYGMLESLFGEKLDEALDKGLADKLDKMSDSELSAFMETPKGKALYTGVWLMDKIAGEKDPEKVYAGLGGFGKTLKVISRYFGKKGGRVGLNRLRRIKSLPKTVQPKESLRGVSQDNLAVQQAANPKGVRGKGNIAKKEGVVNNAMEKAYATETEAAAEARDIEAANRELAAAGRGGRGVKMAEESLGSYNRKQALKGAGALATIGAITYGLSHAGYGDNSSVSNAQYPAFLNERIASGQPLTKDEIASFKNLIPGFDDNMANSINDYIAEQKNRQSDNVFANASRDLMNGLNNNPNHISAAPSSAATGVGGVNNTDETAPTNSEEPKGFWGSFKNNEAFQKAMSAYRTAATVDKIHELLGDKKETDTPTGESQGKGKDIKPYQTWMRYAPVFGSGLLTLTDLFGLTNKPDYSDVAKLEAFANRAGYTPNVSAPYIGDYMKYLPSDRLFAMNQAMANARATDRNLMNISGGNRGTAMAGLLGNGYGTTLNMGNLFRNAEDANYARYQTAQAFNRGTNQFNAQQALQAAIANAQYKQQARQFGLTGLAQAAQLRAAIDQATGASRSANITNFLQSLGNIGRENFAMNQINSNRALDWLTSHTGWSDHKDKA